MSQIPLTKEYADVVGHWGEKIENRSLLLDKFVFPKNWGSEIRVDQASNWSLMRIASNGSSLLHKFSQDLQHRAGGQNVNHQNAENMRSGARVCKLLAETAVDSGLANLRPGHSERFIELLQAQYDDKVLRIVTGRLEGRLAINLAEGLIQNAGINLDRIFGLPLIPGSAVKGVTRSVALAELKQNKGMKAFENFARIFGLGKSDFKEPDGDLCQFLQLLQDCGLPHDDKGEVMRELKGAVSFLPAMPVNSAKIIVDITNVHTPDYYRTGKSADLKNETPHPNYFPAVECGAEFVFPLLLNSIDNDTKLLDTAEKWLVLALQENGIGAKTAAGYGWFCDLTAEKKRQKEEEAARKEQEENVKKTLREILPDPEEVERLSKLDEGNLRGLINIFIAPPEAWNTSDKTQRALLEVPKARELWEKEKSKPKSKVTRALAILAEKFGVNLP